MHVGVENINMTSIIKIFFKIVNKVFLVRSASALANPVLLVYCNDYLDLICTHYLFIQYVLLQHGCTALHMAGNVETARALIAAGADLN